MRQLLLDPQRLDVTAEGIPDFYWPLARHEQQVQRDVMLGALAGSIRSGLRAGDDDWRIMAMCCHWLVAESIALFRPTAIARRAAADGVRLELADTSRLFRPIAEARTPDVVQGHFARFLRAGPTGHGRMLRPLVKLRRSLAWNGRNLAALLPANREHDVIACHRTPLLDLHATGEPRRVRQTLLEEWFSPVSTEPCSAAIRSEVVDACIGAIVAGYAAGGEPLPPSQEQYFREFLSVITRLVRHHYQGLLGRWRSLPRMLWTGSGGYLYARMLRNAVRAHGGVVIGHEHGAGEAHIAYFSAKTLIEYESADAFCTYCWEGADALAETFNPDWHVGETRPRIFALGERTPLVATGTKPAKHTPNKVVRKLMYPSTALLGERVSIDHFVGDYVYLDWAGRLVANLMQSGYQVIHKPHPGGDNRFPPGFAGRFGALQMNEPFEVAQREADAFVLDFSRSSTFPVALASFKPVVYIDFGLERWHPDARALLERRARVVKGHIDDANRFQVDWDEVRLAIEEAGGLSDRSIVSRYYSHLDLPM